MEMHHACTYSFIFKAESKINKFPNLIENNMAPRLSFGVSHKLTGQSLQLQKTEGQFPRPHKKQKKKKYFN